MDPLILKEIPAQSTWPLRHAVLRPNQTLAEMDYPGDRDPETRHFGAFEGGTLVGIASLYREPSPLWRLRGMEADLSGNTSNTPTAAEPGSAHRR